MYNFADIVKEKLFKVIKKVEDKINDFVKNPNKDFTRKRKLPLSKMLKIFISMNGNSQDIELLDGFSYDPKLPTSSAFIQQRNKLSVSAFEYMFNEFNNEFDDFKKFNGHRLLGDDGSSLNIWLNPQDENTYFQSKPDSKGFNQLHINSMYDLQSKIHVDAIIQDGKLKNENQAFVDMIDRSKIEGKVIVTADRGYESYNDFAHIQNKGWNYVIRVKDFTSNGIASNLILPDEDEFDVEIKLFLTRKHCQEVKNNSKIYKYLSSNTTFDYLNCESDGFYELPFRAVRIKISENNYEMLFTNLNNFNFPAETLKTIYHLRWNIETGFRELKHVIGLVNLHAKDKENIKKEIFARLTTYNYCSTIAGNIILKTAKTSGVYQINFTIAVRICITFLNQNEGDKLIDVDSLIKKFKYKIRENRSFKRNVKPTTAIGFQYRVY